jgi:hypothetical protein
MSQADRAVARRKSLRKLRSSHIGYTATPLGNNEIELNIWQNFDTVYSRKGGNANAAMLHCINELGGANPCVGM